MIIIFQKDVICVRDTLFFFVFWGVGVGDDNSDEGGWPTNVFNTPELRSWVVAAEHEQEVCEVIAGDWLAFAKSHGDVTNTINGF